MFVDSKLASRIERAESHLTRAVTESAIAAGRAPNAFVRELAGGVASYLRPGSPMNKVIGAGLDAGLDATSLASVERALGEQSEAVRVELCALAALDTFTSRGARGYELVGFENVLVRPLSLPIAHVDASRIRCVRIDESLFRVWQETNIVASSHADETGVVVDEFSRDVLEDAFADMAEVKAYERYLALWGDQPAGAASLLISDGVAMLGGSATLPAYRRRGVQAALIRARLLAAREQGAELAVVTTAPGSQSQANVMKHGFSLGYARAILVGHNRGNLPDARRNATTAGT